MTTVLTVSFVISKF